MCAIRESSVTATGLVMVPSGGSVEAEEANEDVVVMVASLPEADLVR